jgi:hypothetical protein
VVLFGAGIGLQFALRGGGGGSPTTGASPPAYAGVGDTVDGGHGQDVDGIKCEAEVLVYHVHAHLFILRDGVPQAVPRSIGIVEPALPRCLYWLHTHDTSGIIHVESPTQRLYTLGQFFDIWGMPLARTGVAGLDVPNGELVVFVDGQQIPNDQDPRDIELRAHTQVVIEVGKVVQPPSFQFPQGL